MVKKVQSHNSSHRRTSGEPIEHGNRPGGVQLLRPALHVVLERHRGRGVPRRVLGDVDVLRGVVDVRQHRGAEPARQDGLVKADVLLDAPAHPPHLRVAERLLIPEDEVLVPALRQKGADALRQVDVAAAGFRLGRLNLTQLLPLTDDFFQAFKLCEKID